MRFKIIDKSIEISRTSTKDSTDLGHIDILENCGLGGVIMESNGASMIIKNFPFYHGIDNYKLGFILTKEDLENWILKFNTFKLDYYL